MRNCLSYRFLLLLLAGVSNSVVGTRTRSVQEVLMSVEEKLRGLENLGHTMRFSGLHYGMDQMSRRMDVIEVRLSQMETKLNMRLDKMNEVASVRDRVKVEHIVRKIEAAGERTTAAILESKLKVRMTEAEECHLLERMEQMLEDMTSRKAMKQKQVETDDWKTESNGTYEGETVHRYETTQPPTTETANLQTIAVSYDAASKTLETELADTATHDKVEKTRVDEKRGDEVETFTRKVMNTYQELSKESKAIDASLKEVIHASNRTRATTIEGFRKLHNQQTKSVAAIEELLQTLLKRVLEMSATVDSSFASLLVAQNTFITTCHWVQQQQPVAIEFLIRDTLEGILDDFQNRTTRSSLCDEKGVAQLKKAFESHETDVGRALREIVWTVIEVGNQTTHDVTQQMCNPKHNSETTNTFVSSEPRIEKTTTSTESGDDL